MRCEDYPCCGHAQDPGGCPDFTRVVHCKNCGKRFHPDDLTETYCYVCALPDEDLGEYAGDDE